MPEVAFMALAAAGLFAICALARFSLQLGFIGRPLVVGCLWGLFTGDMLVPVLLGLCCELFWLDLFPIGSYLPPAPAFPLLLLLPLAEQFEWSEPQFFVFPLLVLFPTAYAPPLLEGRLRRNAVVEHERLIEASERFEPLGGLPGKAITLNSIQTALYMASLYLLFFFASALLFYWTESLFFKIGTALPFSWTGIVGLSSLGAFLALRLPKAYFTFFISFIAALWILAESCL